MNVFEDIEDHFRQYGIEPPVQGEPYESAIKKINTLIFAIKNDDNSICKELSKDEQKPMNCKDCPLGRNIGLEDLINSKSMEDIK
jgi:hypothetical protein